MDDSTYRYALQHKLQAPQQAMLQHYDPKGYITGQRSSIVPVDDKPGFARETQYRVALNMEGTYPYQYGHQQVNRQYTEEPKPTLLGTQAHTGPSRRSGPEDYSRMTAMQQRQEYLQRFAQHQQILCQREYAAAAERAMAEQATKRHRPPENNQSLGNPHVTGISEQFDSRVRHGAFSVTDPAHQRAPKIQRQTPTDSLHSSGFTQMPQPNLPHVIETNVRPRQYNHHHQQEQYAGNSNQAKNTMGREPKDIAVNKIRKHQALRDWEAHIQADPKYIQADPKYIQADPKYTKYNNREITQPSTNYPNFQVPSQQVNRDQLDSELAQLKDMVHHMEMLREHRDKVQKVSSFQYHDKVGNQGGNPAPVASVQPTQNFPGSSRKNFTLPYNSMPPPHQHVSSPPKNTESIRTPQKSITNRYLMPMDRQQLHLYQHQTQSPLQRSYQTHQIHQHQQQNATHNKSIKPIQMVTQGLPKIVDVRSLANVGSAKATEGTAPQPSRFKQRGSETGIAAHMGDSRMMRMNATSSPEGYCLEVTEPRSADSCDSGVESTASPDTQISSYLYNRNNLSSAQQHQLEIAKAQHAASFEAMKHHHHQQINRNSNQCNNKNVPLERAGSPLKLSDLLEKEVCPAVNETLDTLTCTCQTCLNHQQKTEIELRGLWRERQIKKYLPALHSASLPKKALSCKCQVCINQQQKSEIGLQGLCREQKIKKYFPALHSSSMPKTSLAKVTSQPNDIIVIEDGSDDNSKHTQNDKVVNLSQRKRVLSSTSELSKYPKKMKIPESAQMNVNNEALDLSKKPKRYSPECEQLGLDLNRQCRSVKTNLLKDAMMQNEIVCRLQQTQYSIKPEEQAITTYMGQEKHGTNTSSQGFHQENTTLAQIITACIDQDDQTKYVDATKEEKNTKAVHAEENQLPFKPKCFENHTVLNSYADQDMKNIDARDINQEIKTNNQQIDNKESKQHDLSSKTDDGDSQIMQEESKSSEQCSNTDEVLEVPMQPQILKVMVEKLKMNADMFLPDKEETFPEQQTLQRASSVPAFKSHVAEDVISIQRARSVGLSNTTSKSNVSATYKQQPLKDNHNSVFQQLQSQDAERPLSAPACEHLSESNNLQTKSEKHARMERQAHCLASLFQPEVKDVTFIPKNQRDCWEEKSSCESKKAKDIGSPKMQWKALWAKEKDMLDLSKNLICKLCGMENTVACRCENKTMQETHENFKNVTNNQNVNSVQSSVKDEHLTLHESIEDPENTTTPDCGKTSEQETVKVTNADNSSKETNFCLATLFQPLQFKQMMNATSMPSPNVEDLSILDKEKRIQDSVLPETHGHLPGSNYPMSVIKGKQHGKATIFHKQSYSTEQLNQQHQALNLVSSKQGECKLNTTVFTIEQEIQDDKHFPRLALSPTAMIDKISFDAQGDSKTLVGHSNQNLIVIHPSVQSSLKNVLRVSPKFRCSAHLESKSVSSQVPVDQTSKLQSLGQAAMLEHSGQASVVQSVSLQPLVQYELQTIPVKHSMQMSMAEPVIKTSKVQPILALSEVQPKHKTQRELLNVQTSTQKPHVQTLVQPKVQLSMLQPDMKTKEVKLVEQPSVVPSTLLSSTDKLVVVQHIEQKSTIQEELQATIRQTERNIPVVHTEQISTEPPMVQTSVVQPVLQSLTVQSAKQAPVIKPLRETTVQPEVHLSTVQPMVQLSVVEVSTRPTVVKALSGQPVVDTSTSQPPEEVSTGQSVTNISAGQSVVEASTRQTVEEASTQQPSVETLQVQSKKQTSTVEPLVQTMGQSAVQTSDRQPVVQISTEQPLEPTSLEQPATDLPTQTSATYPSKGKLVVQTSTGQPVLQTLIRQSVVQASTGQPMVQSSTKQPVVQTSPEFFVQASSGQLVLQVTMAEPVVTISRIHTAMPTSAVQPVMQATPEVQQPGTHSMTDNALVHDLSLKPKVEANLSDGLKLVPISNINRRLRSNAPNIHVPTTNGYSCYQKDGYNMHEIYRVEMYKDLQQLDLKIVPKKKQTVNASKVVYMQHSFHCVIRSETPFVPPQLLQEVFFSSVDYGDFTYALQQCGIMHRYMTMNEQGAMSRACVTRTWNGSCKLIPLDEFDTKFEQITDLLKCTKEGQRQ